MFSSHTSNEAELLRTLGDGHGSTRFIDEKERSSGAKLRSSLCAQASISRTTCSRRKNEAVLTEGVRDSTKLSPGIFLSLLRKIRM